MEELINFFQNFNTLAFLDLVIKAFGLVGAFMYFLFTIVIFRQIQIMKKAVNFNDQGVLYFLGILQIIFALILIFFGVIIL